MQVVRSLFERTSNIGKKKEIIYSFYFHLQEIIYSTIIYRKFFVRLMH